MLPIRVGRRDASSAGSMSSTSSGLRGGVSVAKERGDSFSFSSSSSSSSSCCCCRQPSTASSDAPSAVTNDASAESPPSPPNKTSASRGRARCFCGCGWPSASASASAPPAPSERNSASGDTSSGAEASEASEQSEQSEQSESAPNSNASDVCGPAPTTKLGSSPSANELASDASPPSNASLHVALASLCISSLGCLAVWWLVDNNNGNLSN
ncbi:hypothetical protein BDR26DRAFT_954949, partial [Obelidium mucronatum]